MAHSATLTYSESLVRQAVAAYWRRSVGVGFFVAMAVVAVSLIALLLQGDRSWVIGALATTFVGGGVFVTALYVVHLRNSLRKFRDMGPPEATFLADESWFSVTSSLGTAKMPWSAVSEVWRFGGFWLLLLSKSQFFTFPLAGVSSEMQAFVLERFEAGVSAPVRVNGKLAIPEGAQVSGPVILAEQPGKTSGRGLLQLAYDELRFDGRSYDLGSRSPVFESKSGTKKDVALIGGGAVAGGIVGGVLGGSVVKGAVIGGTAGTGASLLTRGPQLELGRGTALSLRLDQPMSVRTPKSAV